MNLEGIAALFDEEKIPVYGIALAQKMEDEESGYRPEDLLPDSKSMICFGIPVPRSIYDDSDYSPSATWRTQNLLYRKLDTISLRLTILLEEMGEKSLPIYGCMPLHINKKNIIDGVFNQLRMAEVAGMGVIGKNGLLIHSKYGARLMLGGLLTTASLDEVYYPEIDEPGCPPECRICSDACPVDAIDSDNRQVDIMRCLSYTAQTPLMSKLKFILKRARDRKEAARYMNITTHDELTFHICSKCVSVCPYGNES